MVKMKNNRYLYCFLASWFLWMFVFPLSGVKASEPEKPVWVSAISCKLRLSVWNRWDANPTYTAKYIVKTKNGLTLIAEKEGVAHEPESSEVVFPDDFFVEGTRIQPSCTNGADYRWEIYVNNVLVDKGGRFKIVAP